MSIAAFDTHAAVTALREAGFDERQAEGVVATVRDAVVEGVATRADVGRIESQMATKADVAEVKADVGRLEGKIERVESRVERVEDRIEHIEDKMATKADLASLETRVTVRLYGGLFAVVAAVVALIKLLP